MQTDSESLFLQSRHGKFISFLISNVFVPMIVKALMGIDVIKFYHSKYNSVIRTIFLISRFDCSNVKIPNAETSEIRNAHFCILVTINVLTYCYHHYWKPTYEYIGG